MRVQQTSYNQHTVSYISEENAEKEAHQAKTLASLDLSVIGQRGDGCNGARAPFRSLGAQATGKQNAPVIMASGLRTVDQSKGKVGIIFTSSPA